MGSVVKIKRSSVKGKAPTTSDLETGEIAVNLRDSKIFSSDGSNIVELGSNTSSSSIGTLTVGNTSPYTFPTSDGENNQILVTDGSGTLTFQDSGGTSALANTDGSTTITVDTFSKTDFRSCQYFTQIVSIDGIQMSQIHLVHTTNTAFLTEFGKITTAAVPNLGTFNTDTQGDNVRLLYTPESTVYQEQTVTAKRVTIMRDQDAPFGADGDLDLDSDTFGTLDLNSANAPNVLDLNSDDVSFGG